MIVRHTCRTYEDVELLRISVDGLDSILRDAFDWRRYEVNLCRTIVENNECESAISTHVVLTQGFQVSRAGGQTSTRYTVVRYH